MCPYSASLEQATLYRTVITQKQFSLLEMTKAWSRNHIKATTDNGPSQQEA